MVRSETMLQSSIRSIEVVGEVVVEGGGGGDSLCNLLF